MITRSFPRILVTPVTQFGSNSRIAMSSLSTAGDFRWPCQWFRGTFSRPIFNDILALSYCLNIYPGTCALCIPIQRALGHLSVMVPFSPNKLLVSQRCQFDVLHVFWSSPFSQPINGRPPNDNNNAICGTKNHWHCIYSPKGRDRRLPLF